MRLKIKFSVSERQKIIKYAKTHSVNEAAEKYAISAQLIYKWRRNIESDAEKRTRFLVESLLKAVEKFPLLTLKQAAEMFNVSKHIVYNIARKNNIKLNSARISDDDVNRVVSFFDTNPKATLAQAHDTLGLSMRYIMFALKFKNYQRPTLQGVESRLNEDAVRAYIAKHPKATYRDLGSVFGVSRQTIFNFVKKRNIKYRPKKAKQGESFANCKKHDFAVIGKLFRSDTQITKIKISKMTGISLHRVTQYVRNHGIECPVCRPSLTKTELENALATYPTYCSIAENLGLSYSTIARLTKRYGLQKRKNKKIVDE